MRRGARWALGFSAALIAMAAIGGARADVRFIDLDECSTVCLPAATENAAAAEDASDADITLSLFGGRGTERASNTGPDLILDAKALPAVLVSGLPSPIAAVAAETPDSQDVSPYAFFADVIDIPLPVDARTGLSAASIRLFTPSMIGQQTLTDVLSDSRDLFRPLPPLPLRPEM